MDCSASHRGGRHDDDGHRCALLAARRLPFRYACSDNDRPTCKCVCVCVCVVLITVPCAVVDPTMTDRSESAYQVQLSPLTPEERALPDGFAYWY